MHGAALNMHRPVADQGMDRQWVSIFYYILYTLQPLLICSNIRGVSKMLIILKSHFQDYQHFVDLGTMPGHGGLVQIGRGVAVSLSHSLWMRGGGGGGLSHSVTV